MTLKFGEILVERDIRYSNIKARGCRFTSVSLLVLKIQNILVNPKTQQNVFGTSSPRKSKYFFNNVPKKIFPAILRDLIDLEY